MLRCLQVGERWERERSGRLREREEWRVGRREVNKIEKERRKEEGRETGERGGGGGGSISLAM